MNLETTTESFEDQLIKFMAEEREEKKRLDKAYENLPIALTVIFLVIFAPVVLMVLGILIPYRWRIWKSKRAGPVTQIPKTPISNKDLLEYEENKISRAKVYYNSKSYNCSTCTGKLKEIVRVVFNLRESASVYLSDNTRIISIRMDGFSNGAEFHSFEPEDGVVSGSYFTYQMFGDNTIQVTRYVVGNKSYVAGFCIYVKNYSVEDSDINMDVIKKLMEEATYPGKEAVEEKLKEELEKKAGKTNIPSKFAFWKRTSQRIATKTEQNDVPPSYSSLSVV